MKTNNDTINAIQTMVDSAVNKAGYDKTRNAVILARNANNTYKIKMDGIEYDNVICYGAGVFTSGEVAKVFIPNGQASQMYILAINPYPVGSIYQTTDGDFEPSIVWGGKWERIKGKVLVGVDENDIDFSTSENEGGKKERELTASIGSPSGDAARLGFCAKPPSAFQSSHQPTYRVGGAFLGSGGGWSHGTFVTEHGVDSALTNFMPPYITVYMWKRIA